MWPQLFGIPSGDVNQIFTVFILPTATLKNQIFHLFPEFIKDNYAGDFISLVDL